MDQSRRYRYSHLRAVTEQIRIFELFPALSANQPLEGSLHVHAFPDVIATPGQQRQDLCFEAVSYVWETSHVPSTLEIDGNPLKIGGNLSLALRFFRHAHKRRRLWIDAICINQHDAVERTAQVSMMTDIYQKAARTPCWIGTPYTVTNRHQYPIAFEQLLQDFFNCAGLPDTCMQWHEDDTRFIRGVIEYERAGRPRTWINHGAVNAVFLDSYFSRRWILQEIGMASKVTFCFHGIEVDGPRFVRVGRAFAALQPHSDVPFLQDVRPYQHVMDLPVASLTGMELTRPPPADPGVDFLETMLKFQDFDCKEPLDRIAALKWLWFCNLTFDVDYSRFPEQEYHRFAVLMASMSPSTRCMLLHAAAPRTFASPLPSWVPDWRSTTLKTAANWAFLMPHQLKQANEDTMRLEVIQATPDSVLVINMLTQLKMSMRLSNVRRAQARTWLSLPCPAEIKSGDIVLDLSRIDSHSKPKGLILRQYGDGHILVSSITVHLRGEKRRQPLTFENVEDVEFVIC